MKKRVQATPTASVPHQDQPFDIEAFEREMVDVVRLRPDPRGRIRVIPVVQPRVPKAVPSDQVDGQEDSFAAPGVNRRQIRKVKRGEYVVEDQLDLHGMTTAQARTRVKQFIEKSRHRRRRCVCIVHGRGLHSEGNRAVLKASVREWLRSEPSVVVYADAPRSDGGAGAVYVLLRT